MLRSLSMGTINHLIALAEARRLADEARRAEYVAQNGDAEGYRFLTASPEHIELVEFLDGLSFDQKSEIVALMWLGRGDGLPAGADVFKHWRGLLRDASGHPSSYIAGKAPLSAYLKKGLAYCSSGFVPDEDGYGDVCEYDVSIRYAAYYY